MKKTISVKEAAQQWGVSQRRVTDLCREGRIDGAQKSGHTWLIPADTPKPKDQRVRSGNYRRPAISTPLPLPIGISDYRKASTQYYYIDKTLMIRDFLDERPMVSLFTRPRRFGKTLNMDMLRTFFEKSDADTSIYFRNKKIWACGKKYQDEQGKYPVIFLTFKDVKCDSWAQTYDLLTKLIRLEFKRHRELSDAEQLADYSYYNRIVSGQANENDFALSLQLLSKMLHEYHGIAPIIIIDEYDTPIQQGHTQDFYGQIVGFMRRLFSGALKDNPNLSYGFLTGILRVAKESIFSGLNNLKINSILDNRYSAYFGFTPDEVRQIADYYGVPEKYPELCRWYDGYRFGKNDIFNPWSVINYFGADCEPQAFWQSTGSNEVIGEILSQADEETYDRLNALLQGQSILCPIDTGVIYPQIGHNPSTIFSFLLVAGYLKVLHAGQMVGGERLYAVALPNQEITYVYQKEILQKLTHIIPSPMVISIQTAICSGDTAKLQTQLRKLLLQSVSYHDTAGESFYHGLVLGLCAMLDGRYQVRSNRESGEGRYDIQLFPKDKQLPGVLIELKAQKGTSPQTLKALAETALAQIHDRQYDTEMTTSGIKTIFKYGIAFDGKNVEIATAGND